MNCKDIETPAMILGNLFTVVALAGPLFFKDAWSVSPRYYFVFSVMTAVLALLRGTLVRLFPDVHEFARPKKHGEKLPILEFFYRGGMPSGHSAMVTLFCGLLLMAYPNIVVGIFGFMAVFVVAVFRYCKEYHTVPQLLAGISCGLFTAIASSRWILQI